MPIVRAPGIMTREVKLEDQSTSSRRLRSIHRKQRGSTSSIAVIKKVLWAGPGLPKWREARRAPTRPDKPTPSRREGGPDEATLESPRLHLGHPLPWPSVRSFSTRTLSQTADFPVSLPCRAPQAFLSFKYLYCAAPVHNAIPRLLDRAFGPVYFTLKARQTISPGRFQVSDPVRGMTSFLSSARCTPRKPVPAKAPPWLTIPERGLFTGIPSWRYCSGKTSCCMLPFAEQILATKPLTKRSDRRV